MATIQESSAGLAVDQLLTIEALVGGPLPPEYENFLRGHNGGYPEPDGFSYSDGSDGSSVDRFLSLERGEPTDLMTYYRRYLSRVPPGFLAVAQDPGGNLICVSLGGATKGQVFFWDHECEAEAGAEPDMSNMHHLATDFDEFLARLTEVGI